MLDRMDLPRLVRNLRIPRAPRQLPQRSPPQPLHPDNHILSPMAGGLLAPFSPQVAGRVTAGDPSGVPTLKVTARAVGIITCNSAGRGQALIVPCVPNDGIALQVTSSTWAPAANASPGNDFSRASGAAAAGTSDIRHNGPYDTATLTASLPTNSGQTNNNKRMESRINVIGIRVTPTGPVLNRSGTVYIVRPAHAADVSNMTSAMYIPESNTHSVSVSEMPANYEYAFGPFNMDDTEMSEDPYNWVSPSSSVYWDQLLSTQTARAAVCGIAVVGCTSGFTFRVEVVFHMEFSGDQVASISTPTTADFTGTVNALSLASDIDKVQKSDPTVHRSVAAQTAHVARAAAGPLSMAAQAGVPGAGLALTADHLLGNKKTDSSIAKAASATTAASKMLKLKL